jgi:hypothetical protein
VDERSEPEKYDDGREAGAERSRVHHSPKLI